MIENLPWSEACERNREPIWEALGSFLPERGIVLEIGSCTGQHVVHFAAQRPDLIWQPSDQSGYLTGLSARLAAEGRENIMAAMELDVNRSWPDQVFDAVYSANTAHIMSWQSVEKMVEGVSLHLAWQGHFCLYGPFNLDGEYTAPSNARFDSQLRSRDRKMGLRSVEALDSLAAQHHLCRISRVELPANNMMLVYQKETSRDV